MFKEEFFFSVLKLALIFKQQLKNINLKKGSQDMDIPKKTLTENSDLFIQFVLKHYNIADVPKHVNAGPV